MGGLFEGGWGGNGWIRTFGRKRRFERGRRGGWPSLQCARATRAANRFSGRKSRLRSEVWIRSKRFAKRWGICSGAWNVTKIIGWTAWDRTPYRLSVRHTQY